MYFLLLHPFPLFNFYIQVVREIVFFSLYFTYCLYGKTHSKRYNIILSTNATEKCYTFFIKKHTTSSHETND